jgi:enoyl-CoA hydratase/3-hydroxyacyl-CoA dehydrogenase
MAYVQQTRSLTKIGIVGSGQIGPDIALHFTKELHGYGVPVVVVDISLEALAAGRAKLTKKIANGVETKAFRPDEAEAMKTNVTFTEDYEALRGSSLVIEAASEDLALKRRIFAHVEELAASGAILASNSSHLEPERIFETSKDPSRALVIHYFFPAERNPAVEIVPGGKTDEGLVNWLLDFYEAIGKVPIRVKSRYGYAIDPIFEALIQSAVSCVEEDLGTSEQVDYLATEALGLGVGPFTAMNLTGGTRLTAHGLDEMHERVHPWFKTPKLLHEAARDGRQWNGCRRGEKPSVPREAARKATERFQGTYFGVVGEVLDSGITSLADLEMAVQIALVVRPPFQFMNEIGLDRALELVRNCKKIEPDFPEPQSLVRQAESGEPWEVPYVLRRDEDDVAVLVIRRPQVLNALNQDVFAQLDRHIVSIEKDDRVQAMVITGFGRKAFVSGADVSMLAAIRSPAEGERLSLSSHAVMNRIAQCPKPVICALNGLALGGGNELALACHARLARAGLKVLAGQPEPNLGLIPGAGATQRLPRLIGLEKAWPLLRTGRPVSGPEALEMGLINKEVDGDLRAAAVGYARDAARGKTTLQRIPRDPIEIKDLPDVAIGHLSRAVDAVLQKAILEGARMPLEEGLRFEARCFGEVCGLDDMRIGLDNFIENGPRSRASFIHR